MSDGRCLKAAFKNEEPFLIILKKNEYHPVLDQQLSMLGNIGEHSRLPGKRYVIGNCAINMLTKNCR